VKYQLLSNKTFRKKYLEHMLPEKLSRVGVEVYQVRRPCFIQSQKQHVPDYSLAQNWKGGGDGKKRVMVVARKKLVNRVVVRKEEKQVERVEPARIRRRFMDYLL
jgi:hypothetical protein